MFWFVVFRKLCIQSNIPSETVVNGVSMKIQMNNIDSKFIFSILVKMKIEYKIREHIEIV